MTHLRKMMLEELQRRNFAQSTIQYYLQAVEDFAAYFHKPPLYRHGPCLYCLRPSGPREDRPGVG